MINEQTEKDREEQDNKDAAVKPDPETQNTTDPQEHMKGPVSSLVQGTGEKFDSEKSEKEAEEKKKEKRR